MKYTKIACVFLISIIMSGCEKVDKKESYPHSNLYNFRKDQVLYDTTLDHAASELLADGWKIYKIEKGRYYLCKSPDYLYGELKNEATLNIKK